AILGNPGQAGYAAANAVLDAMAHAARGAHMERRRVLSIDWGPWRLGMAERVSPSVRQRWDAMGITPLRADDGFAALSRILGATSEASPQVTVLPVRWPAFLDALGATPPLFRMIAPD